MPLDQNNESVVLFDSNGVEMNVLDGVAIPANTRGLLVMGTDGANSRRLGVDASGRAAIQNPTNLDIALSTRLAEATFTGRVNTLGQKTMANSTPVVLASDQAAIPVTPTAVADPATFTVFAPSVVIALNKSMVSIVNTSAAVTAQIYRIYIVNVQLTAITGVVAHFELRRITGHSVGAAIIPLPFDTNDVLNAGITAITGSTVAGESASMINRWLWSSDEWAPGAADVESADHALQTLNPVFDRTTGTKPLILRQNQGFTIKQTTNSVAGSFDIYVLFSQV